MGGLAAAKWVLATNKHALKATAAGVAGRDKSNAQGLHNCRQQSMQGNVGGQHPGNMPSYPEPGTTLLRTTPSARDIDWRAAT